MKITTPPRDLWNSVYRKLYRAWEDAGSFGSPPPAPVGIGRDDLSDHQDRDEAWRQTVQWASEQGLQHMLPKPPPEKPDAQ